MLIYLLMDDVLVFDTETTGLPKTKGFGNFYSYKDLSKYDSSRIVQISWRLFKNKVCVKEYDYVIKPDNFEIHNSEIHGITTEFANKNGYDLEYVANIFLNDIQEADTIVAHNYNFDKNILLSELYRKGCFENLISIFESKNSFCTMDKTTNILNLKNKGGYIKAPRLSELYTFLFNKDPTNLHDSKYDTRHTSDCFFELIDKNYI